MSRQQKRAVTLREFFILGGVRRALASRMAGLKTIPAVIYREGRPPEYRPRMKIALLFSPKGVVPMDARFLRIIPPIKEPIEVEPRGARAQSRSVPLPEVELE